MYSPRDVLPSNRVSYAYHMNVVHVLHNPLYTYRVQILVQLLFFAATDRTKYFKREMYIVALSLERFVL